jgi:hypothetical protein
VPAHNPASAEGAKLKPVDVAVAEAAGGLVAPPAVPAAAVAALAPVLTPDPEAVGPLPPSASAGDVVHGTVVVVVLVVVDLDLDAVVVVVVVVDVVDEPPLGGVVVGVVEVVVVHGTVVAVPAAWATCPASVPPPVAPR